MTLSITTALLASISIMAVVAGSLLLRQALLRPTLLPEELALSLAWIYIVGALVWLDAFLHDTTLLGFYQPWTWLAAAHFTFAGWGALTITALTCRVVSNRRALKILRTLLAVHPVAYLMTAAGIVGVPYGDECSVVIYQLLFTTQLGAVVFGQADRIAHLPKRLLILALTVPVFTIIPAITWAWGNPILDMSQMVAYHGIVNALGHVGLGLTAFYWGRPLSHSSVVIRAPSDCEVG